MWKIGQEIVCIKTHSQGLITKGEHCFIKGIYPCKCGRPAFDIGKQKIAWMNNISECTFCGYLEDSGRIALLDHELFRPVQYCGNAISEILEKFKPEECRPDVEIKQIPQEA